MTDFSGNADDDRRLLRRFGEKRDEASFRALVERYSGIVYGTAMRKTGRPEWAADITQNVFISLGKKALQLSRAEIPSVGAWLHRAATLESLRHLRDQINSQRRDEMLRKGLDENPMYPAHGIREQVLPQLDEALEKLPAKDRDILILHYFDGLRFGDIASRLGLRADAVQKRSIRALEKLSRLLKTRSELLPVSVLAALLSSELSKAAPVSLITQTIHSAVSAKAVGGKTITLMTLTSKSTIAGASAVLVFLAALLGVGYFTQSGEKTAQSNRPPSRPEGRSAPASSIADETPGVPGTPPTTSRPDSMAEAGEESPLVSAMNRLRELGSEREAVMA